jgi:16S rRNA pseudouridine516 synthase
VFLTTDGKLAHRVTGPKNHVNKKYFVTVDKPIQSDWIAEFQKGITIDDGYTCKPAFLEILSETTCHLTIFEGKFHQVKRMFAAVENHVERLMRVSMGGLELPVELGKGQHIELLHKDVEKLFSPLDTEDFCRKNFVVFSSYLINN